jgi:hypothetical protein
VKRLEEEVFYAMMEAGQSYFDMMRMPSSRRRRFVVELNEKISHINNSRSPK